MVQASSSVNWSHIDDQLASGSSFAPQYELSKEFSLPLTPLAGSSIQQRNVFSAEAGKAQQSDGVFTPWKPGFVLNNSMSAVAQGAQEASTPTPRSHGNGIPSSRNRVPAAPTIPNLRLAERLNKGVPTEQSLHERLQPTGMDADSLLRTVRSSVEGGSVSFFGGSTEREAGLNHNRRLLQQVDELVQEALLQPVLIKLWKLLIKLQYGHRL